MSPSGDKRIVHQEFCENWQLFWTYFRSTLEVQLGAHLASNLRPFGVDFAPRGTQVGSGGSQEAQVEPKRRPRDLKMSPKGAPETLSSAQEAPKRPPIEPKRLPRRFPELPEGSPRALGDHKRQFAEFAFSCARERGFEGWGHSGRALGRQVGGQNGVQVCFGSSNWRSSAAEQPNLAVQVQLGAQLGAQMGIFPFGPG